VSKREYVVLNTGEVKEFERSESRADLLNSVRQSLNRLRDYINANVVDCTKCRWITLTYAENMTDSKRLYSDFKKFIMRMRYRYEFEYIVAVEPQGRGAWHIHMIAIFEGVAPFIPNIELERLWGHGFTKIKAVKDIDNLGVYFTAYLADMELTMDEQGLEVLENTDNPSIKDKVGKPIVKGGRLYMYPAGMNIYRISKGIKPPTISRITEDALQEEIKDLELTYEKAIKISADNTEFVIYYRYFNRLRKKDENEEVVLWDSQR
jgi:hypothetical protein